MSHLSPQEVNAGISRRALAAVKRNGDSQSKRVAIARIVGDGTTETPILESPYRRLSVLETHDGRIILRDACFTGSKCDVALIHLEPDEARQLGARLVREVSE